MCATVGKGGALEAEDGHVIIYMGTGGESKCTELMRMVRCLAGCAVPRGSYGAASCQRMVTLCAHSVDNGYTIREVYPYIG